MPKLRIGFAMTGSFCTHSVALDALESLLDDYEIIPIVSEMTASTDTRFGRAEDLLDDLAYLCGRKVISTIPEAEPIGPQKLLDILVIAPCTGNTLAKLATGIADTSVTLAAKAHLRSGKPIVLGISTNDGLGTAAQNIGALLARKHYYFVPFGQDAPHEKPNSLVADFSQLKQTIESARRRTQIQPLLL